MLYIYGPLVHRDGVRWVCMSRRAIWSLGLVLRYGMNDENLFMVCLICLLQAR